MKYLCILCFFLTIGNVYSQDFCNDLMFVSHLINTGQYDEAAFCLHKTINQKNLNQSTLDSINYLSGWAAYNQKKLDTSAFYLLNVSINSQYYYKSHFFAGYDYCYLGDYKKSTAVLDEINEKDSNYFQLKLLEKMGICLLQKDYKNYNLYSQKLKYPNYSIAKEKNILNEIYNHSQCFNPKSIIFAGFLSTIIPGLGKVYAGKLGEGITAFTTVGILAAITMENYIKAGPYNYKTLLFGSLFTVFYIGNIYGSAISIKVYRNEFYKNNEKSILFNIHIPLRTMFN